jgi:hypothetical protein
MSDVFFQIVSPLPLNRHQDARKLFQLWADNAPRFLPNRWGLSEPLRHPFSLATLDDAIRTWELAYYVKRTATPRLESGIQMQYGPHRQHSNWSITLKNIKDFEQRSFCRLLKCAAVAFSADLGFIHKITDTEIPKGRQNASICYLDAAHTEKHLYVVTHDLVKFLPDIYWMTVFGRPYVQLFSRERLLSCPAHHVKELDNGSIVVQLTPELRNITDEEAAFERVRQEARNHLNNDAFFDLAKGSEYHYRVPEFVWGPIIQ